jgi:hypothetical protein
MRIVAGTPSMKAETLRREEEGEVSEFAAPNCCVVRLLPMR